MAPWPEKFRQHGLPMQKPCFAITMPTSPLCPKYLAHHCSIWKGMPWVALFESAPMYPIPTSPIFDSTRHHPVQVRGMPISATSFFFYIISLLASVDQCLLGGNICHAFHSSRNKEAYCKAAFTVLHALLNGSKMANESTQRWQKWITLNLGNSKSAPFPSRGCINTFGRFSGSGRCGDGVGCCWPCQQGVG